MIIINRISEIKNRLKYFNLPTFLEYNFLNFFYKENKKIDHLYFLSKHSFLIGHTFYLKLNKSINYLKSNIILIYILKYSKIKILFLGNSYFTNFPFFLINRKFDVFKILKNMDKTISLVIIPDVLMKFLTNNSKYNFIKLRIEDDMILELKSEWKDLSNYINSMKSKYKKKINKILERSNVISRKHLKLNDLDIYDLELQSLFDQVVDRSRFNGPEFNTKTFSNLVSQNYLNIYGYFLNEKLIAFSSYFENDQSLISYYVGFDQKLKDQYSLYSRILIDTIDIAIKNRKEKIIFGRTANEFKSNFGAVPLKSHIYIHFNNRFIHYLFKNILKKYNLNKWILRSPFKN